MKYLEGSKFSVHVGGSAYGKGWDRIFGSSDAAPTAPAAVQEPSPAPVGCFGCEYVHVAGCRCFCECHAL